MDEPGYGIGAVSRLLGVPAATLRTWNLRYGIGPSRRSEGGHRRYDQNDLRRLAEMNRLINAGLPAAEAARAALELRTLPPPPKQPQKPPSEPIADVAPSSPVPTVAMLARAAARLDSRALDPALDAAFTRHGVAWTWEHLVRPVFAAIVSRQVQTGTGVEIEHLFSDRVVAALHPLIERRGDSRPVLLACAEDEQHSLPLYALAAVLASESGVDTRVLGARTPYSALADAMRAVRPPVLFVWSQLEATGDPAPLAALPSLRPPCTIIAGGPGWWPEQRRVASLGEAVAAVIQALSATRAPSHPAR
ncbi:MerR family transcriptional regulator [Nonomuraea soli]|uniref:DNA-binding transcriptional MerR regulator n=1 Tax=Nonomuraea soli TaxID=1032476 RepID=A0A7W0HV97_9ACTN|nr:MerR family transcriptional regulator [Nonomuraea soli]MBA2896797.1 DNA-binding transcriptional MerR regulator [Nonomuraea soli]